LRGESSPFPDQEAVSGDAEGRVVMKTAPASPFVVAQAELLLEFLIIALDTAA